MGLLRGAMFLYLRPLRAYLLDFLSKGVDDEQQTVAPGQSSIQDALYLVVGEQCL